MAVTDEAIDKIKDMIVSGELSPGDRLPKEADLADRLGLSFDPREAIQWATQRGSRSGRVAWQYVVELAGRNGVAL